MITGEFRLVLRLGLGLLADGHLDPAPLFVQAVELGRDLPRLLGVGRGQQPHAEVRFADPAAGVDPRPEREAEVAAGRRLHQPRRLGKCREPDILPRRHDPQALGHEGAVEALKPCDIGHGAERDQVEQVEDLGLGERLEGTASAQFAEQRDAEQERHAHGGKMPVRGAVRALVEAVGIDQRMGDREQAGALVVVDDDHVEPGRAGLLQRLERLRSAIDAHRDARAARLELDQRLARRPIALHQPVWDIDDRLGAEPAEQQHQQRGAGRAIDVIVAEDRDRLALLDGVGEALGALVHVLEAARVGQEVADLRLAMPRQILARHSAGEQQLVDQFVHSGATARPAAASATAAH